MKTNFYINHDGHDPQKRESLSLLSKGINGNCSHFPPSGGTKGGFPSPHRGGLWKAISRLAIVCILTLISAVNVQAQIQNWTLDGIYSSSILRYYCYNGGRGCWKNISNQTINDNIVLTGGSASDPEYYGVVINVTGGRTTVINGDISGNGSIIKVGAGRLILNGNNTYTGRTIISSGTLELGPQASIANTTEVIFNPYADLIDGAYGDYQYGNYGRLEINGGLKTIKRLHTPSPSSYPNDYHRDARVILNNNAILCIGTFNGNGGGGTFLGSFEGTGTIRKHGSGKLVLRAWRQSSGNYIQNTFTGRLSIEQGEVLFHNNEQYTWNGPVYLGPNGALALYDPNQTLYINGNITVEGGRFYFRTAKYVNPMSTGISGPLIQSTYLSVSGQPTLGIDVEHPNANMTIFTTGTGSYTESSFNLIKYGQYAELPSLLHTTDYSPPRSLIFESDASPLIKNDFIQNISGAQPGGQQVTTGKVNEPFRGCIEFVQFENFPTSSYISAGALPDGLMLAGAVRGILPIMGTPTKAGIFNFTISTLSDFGSDSKSYTLTIGKGDGAAVSGGPTLASQTSTSITLNPVTIPINPGGQTVEYALGSADGMAAPWQDGLTFSGLNDAVLYTAWARSKENADYNAGRDASNQVQISLVTAAPSIQIGTLLPSAIIGRTYSQYIPATGRVTLWELIGTLPAGLSLNTSTGLISGTPSVAGTVLIGIKVYNALGDATGFVGFTVLSDEPTVTVSVENVLNTMVWSPQVNNNMSLGGQVVFRSNDIRFMNASQFDPDDFTVTDLPPGVTADPAVRVDNNTITIRLWGVPTEAGDFIISVPATLTDDKFIDYVGPPVRVTGTTITVRQGFYTAPIPPIEIEDVTQNTITLAPTYRNIIISGQTAGPLEYAISTSATAPSTGWSGNREFTGLTANTSYYVWLRYAETNSYVASATPRNEEVTTLPNPPGSISPTTLPGGTTGVSYNQTLTSSNTEAWHIEVPDCLNPDPDTDLCPPINFLPPGLTLDDATGVISGIPTEAGTFPFTVIASNRADEVSQTYTIVIAQGSSVAVGTQTGRMTENVASSVTYAVTTNGIADATYPVAISTLPTGVTILNNEVVIASGSGTLTLVGDATTLAGVSDHTLEINSIPSSPFTLTIEEDRTIVVGAQNGTLMAGINGSVTFDVTTTGFANGNYTTATVATLPGGVSFQGEVYINTNNGTLTLRGDNNTSAGTTSLTLTIDGTTSGSFTLTIAAVVAKNVTVVTPSATLTAGVAGVEAEYDVMTTGIVDGTYPVNIATLPGGVSVQGGEVVISNNSGKLILEGSTSTGLGTTNHTVTIDGVTSGNFTLVIVAAGTSTVTVSSTGLDNLKLGQTVSGSIIYTLNGGDTYVAGFTATDFDISGLPPGLTAGTPVRSASGTEVTIDITGTPSAYNASPTPLTIPTSIPAANFTTTATAVTVYGSAVAGAVAKMDGAAVSGAPVVSGSPTETTITVGAVTIPTNPGSQTVEYAISTSATPPASGWQTGTTFGSLSPGTTYYVFARSAETTDYAAGTPQHSAPIATATPVTPPPPPTVTPPSITTTANLPSGSEGAAYNVTLSASGTSPTWSIQSGSLPPGLTLSTNGTISGTPTQEGTFTFTVMASNSAGLDTKVFTIVISQPVGTENITADVLKVYPTPFSNEVRITGAYSESSPTILRVISTLGVVVYTQQITSADEILHLGSLPAGLYFFRLENDGKVVTLKVVKR